MDKNLIKKPVSSEVETKILNIDSTSLKKTLRKLKAKKVQEIRLKVTWYRKIGWGEGDDEWFLRIRDYGDEKYEVTWKAKSLVEGIARKHKEINFFVNDSAQTEQLFEELGLEKYAFQEKGRISWVLKKWRFDLDQYPGMPACLEIEGRSDEHIREAIKLLDLGKKETSSEGERVLIQKKYGLNWYEMRF
jgi:adenylate cyclase class 2